MKKNMPSQSMLSVLAIVSAIMAMTTSCSKDGMDNINTSIFFEANLLQGKSYINYGRLPYGKRPENIREAGIFANEITGANGEIHTVIGIVVVPESDKLGPITAFIKLIKLGTALEGVYKTPYVVNVSSFLVVYHISIPGGDYWMNDDGLTVTIQKTGESDISGPYAEGFYTLKGANFYNPNDSATISGNFRLYLQR